MKAKALIKILNSGDNGELRKGLGVLSDKLATLERDVVALEATPRRSRLTTATSPG